jgi:acyl carrier protein
LRALERSLGVPVIEAYSMTEASHQMTSNPLPPGARKAGAVGLPAGAEVAIIGADGDRVPQGAIGEVIVRGPGVMSGYGGDPGLTQAAFIDGWFRTGDLGRLDADGYLFIAGRVKEIVNRGGEKVSPREIDEALLECEAVTQAVAFGLPHPTLGEDLVAVVVLAADVSFDENALRAQLFARLAANKVPSAIACVPEIPKGATGKVQRSALAARLAHLFKPAYVAPRDELERRVATQFEKLLNLELVGALDNFFALGGDSLKGTQLVVALEGELGVALPATAVFQYPTVTALARVIEQALNDAQAREAALAEEIAAMSEEEVAALLAQEGVQPIGASSA